MVKKRTNVSKNRLAIYKDMLNTCTIENKLDGEKLALMAKKYHIGMEIAHQIWIDGQANEIVTDLRKTNSGRKPRDPQIIIDAVEKTKHEERLSLSKLAKATGISKTILHRAIQLGHIQLDPKVYKTKATLQQQVDSFDQEILQWLNETNTDLFTISPIQVRKYALEVAKTKEGMENFRASDGWYYRFCRRHKLCSTRAKSYLKPSYKKAKSASKEPVNNKVTTTSNAGVQEALNNGNVQETDGSSYNTHENSEQSANFVTVCGEQNENTDSINFNATTNRSTVHELIEKAIQHFIGNYLGILTASQQARFIHWLSVGDKAADIYLHLDATSQETFIRNFKG